MILAGQCRIHDSEYLMRVFTKKDKVAYFANDKVYETYKSTGLEMVTI